MVQIFYMFLMLWSAGQLIASDSLVILQPLGKPPLARPSERVNQQMKIHRSYYKNRDDYQSFLLTLFNKIESEIKSVQDDQFLKELKMYQNAVQKDLEAIDQAIQFEREQEAFLIKEYEQEAKNILENGQSGLSPVEFEKKLKDLTRATSDALLQDNLSLENAKRLKIHFEIFSQALKKLQAGVVKKRKKV